MNDIDDDRRDIALMGDIDAKQLNRMAKRNHGRNPFEVSADAITRHAKNGTGSPAKNSPDADHQCQIIPKGNEMNNTSDSTKTTAENTPTWAVPAKRWQCGTDVMHQGAEKRLERVNDNGDAYHLTIQPVQLEELGAGFISPRYFTITAGGEGSMDTMFNVDESELETIADWFCGVVEKFKN